MVNQQEVEQITAEIYSSYGSSTGYLFGLEPRNRSIAEAIVKATLIIKERD